MEELSNVIQPQNDHLTEDIQLKGKWNSSIFKNENPIVLELGCGKGEYSVELSERYPDKNFIGMKASLLKKYTNSSNLNILDLCCGAGDYSRYIDTKKNSYI